MGKTLKELEEENIKLRTQIAAKKELIEIGRKRNELKKENQKLLKFSKNPQFYSAISRLGKASGMTAKKVGKGLFNTLQKMEQTRLRNEALQRKLRRKTRTSSKRKSPSQKKKR